MQHDLRPYSQVPYRRNRDVESDIAEPRVHTKKAGIGGGHHVERDAGKMHLPRAGFVRKQLDPAGISLRDPKLSSRRGLTAPGARATWLPRIDRKNRERCDLQGAPFRDPVRELQLYLARAGRGDLEDPL